MGMVMSRAFRLSFNLFTWGSICDGCLEAHALPILKNSVDSLVIEENIGGKYFENHDC